MSNGIDESKIEEVLESFKKAEREEGRSKIKRKENTWKTLAKYFVHGIVFSLLFTVLVIAWIFGFLILVILGSFIGLIIGLGILMLIIGGLNSFLTGLLWFRVKTSFWCILGHGIVLFIVLLIVNGIFVLAPSLAFPGIGTTVVTFVIGSFLDGFVGKKVAGWWKEEYREGIPQAVEAEWRNRNL